MKCIEEISLDKLNNFKKLDYDTYLSLSPIKKEKGHNKKTKEEHFKLIKNYIERFCANKGSVEHIYEHSKKNNPDYVERIFAGQSIQQIDGVIRGGLFGDTTTDIDMKNTAPMTLEWLCSKNDILCPCLSDYNKNVDRYKTTYTGIKMKVVSYINSNKKTRNGAKDEEGQLLNKLDKEIKSIQIQLSELEMYKEHFKFIVGKVAAKQDDTKKNNNLGCFVNSLLCHYENKFLEVMIKYCTDNTIKICACMYDGLLVYGDLYEQEEHLSEMANLIKEEYNIDITLTYKQHNKSLSEKILYDIKEKDTNVKEYSVVKEKFEKTHCKIVNQSCYIIEDSNGDFILKNETAMRASFRELRCNKYVARGKGGGMEEVRFIDAWFDDPSIRNYKTLNVYPNPDDCPADIYNTWKPYAAESLEGDYDQSVVDRFLNHIKILCNNNEEVAAIIIQWFAHIIQYPAIKSFIPCFISKEGAGKGNLLNVIYKILGSDKTLETAKPSLHCFGTFNSPMAGVVLVNLDELNKPEMSKFEGELKNMTTTDTINIHYKGKDVITMASHHRFVICSNNEIEAHEGDRRKYIINCSDELVNDVEYHTAWHRDILNDANSIYSIYRYLMDYPCPEKFEDVTTFPKTEYQTVLIEESKDYVTRFLEDFALENCKKTEVKHTPIELFELWKKWCGTNEAMPGTKPSFEKKLNLKLLTAFTNKRGAEGRYKLINIKTLLDELKLGIKGECVIDTNESDSSSEEEEFDDENDP